MADETTSDKCGVVVGLTAAHERDTPVLCTRCSGPWTPAVQVVFTNIDTGVAQTVTVSEAEANKIVTEISGWRMDAQWFVVEVRDAQ